ncbi:MAG: hypothetical protein ABL884_11480 [Methyloglobulus sp.]
MQKKQTSVAHFGTRGAKRDLWVLGFPLSVGVRRAVRPKSTAGATASQEFPT